MANVDAPSGFKPIGHALGGTPGRFAPTPYKMQSGYATALYTGDAVVLTSGYLARAADNSATICGIFAGCSYTNADSTNIPFAAYWPASQTTLGAADFIAFVWDDPGIIYEVQSDTGTAYVHATHLGGSYDVELDHAGSALTGQSGMELDLGDASDTQFLVLGLIDRPGNAVGTNAKLAVKIRKSLVGQS